MSERFISLYLYFLQGTFLKYILCSICTLNLSGAHFVSFRERKFKYSDVHAVYFKRGNISTGSLLMLFVEDVDSPGFLQKYHERKWIFL